MTLSQVADLAGVSVPTVSLVLNDKQNCWASENTKQRVRAAAKELGYRPNLAARALRSGSPAWIGLITVNLSLGIEGAKTYGFYDMAAANGYSLMFAYTPNDPNLENESIKNLLDCGVQALAIYPTDTGKHEELRKLVSEGFPVVTFDGKHILDFPSDDAYVDFEAVASLQLEYLLESGKSKILLINTKPNAAVNAAHDICISNLLKRKGLPPCLTLEVDSHSAETSRRPEAEFAEILNFVRAHKKEFDGVVALDPLASLALRALLTEGVKVPEEVAVVGAGNTFVSSYGINPFPSVDTNDYMLGKKAFSLLKDRLDGKTETNVHPTATTPVELARR